MGNINQGYNDRVRYTLKNKTLGSLVISEPMGWNEDDKELARNEQYHGIMAKFSNALKFIDDGKEFIDLCFELEGINTEIELIKEEKHPKTDVFTLLYRGYLDHSTKSLEKNQLSIKFNAGGIEQLLKTYDSEKVEIDRETSISGVAIDPLVPLDLTLDGTRIFLQSKMKATEALTLEVSGVGVVRNQTGGMPLEIVNKSHIELSDVASGSLGDAIEGGAGMMLFLKAEKQRLLDIDLAFTFRTNITGIERFNYGNYQLALTQFAGGDDFTIKDRKILYYTDEHIQVTMGGSAYGNSGVFHSVSWAGQIDMAIGDSLALEFLIHADIGSGGDLGTKNGWWTVETNSISGEINLNEDSSQDATATKIILAHELLDRATTIATGKKKAFYSDFFGRTDLGYASDGVGSTTAVTHGFWVRGFDKLPQNDDNKFKPLTTSFKEAISSLSAVWNIGLGIETIGNSERVRVEDLSFFWNKNTTIRLPNQVKNVKRSPAMSYYYSSLEFGYLLGGDKYEEAFGLDEFNSRNTFTTVISKFKKVFSKLSEYRADSLGLEFQRRKQKITSQTEDTNGDNDIWLLDLKRKSTTGFETRKWQTDFEKKPTGIYSADTVLNLRFSPLNCLLRHAWWFTAGFTKNLTDRVRYSTSKANSKLRTKLIGGIERAENEDIINSELANPRFVPEEIEFEHVCDFDIMQQINGFSIILGKRIMNVYGLVEFINEKNEKEKGFLLNLKPNGKGQWKLLKSYN